MTRIVNILIVLVLAFSKSNGQASDANLKNKPKSYYVYNSSLQNRLENFKAGYIDTFSIENKKFRIIQSGEILGVEYLKNNRWVFNFRFDCGQRGYDYTRDVNNDCFPDFSIDYKWTFDVHLFNPVKNKFGENGLDVYENWELIDSSRNIFCDFQEYNFTHSFILSDLYTIKNGKKQILSELKFKQYQNEYGDSYYKKASQFNYSINGKMKPVKVVTSDTFIEDNKAGGLFDFDYVSYWKASYKKLLGYR